MKKFVLNAPVENKLRRLILSRMFFLTNAFIRIIFYDFFLLLDLDVNYKCMFCFVVN